MKNLILILTISFFAISCTKEDSPIDLSKSGGESYVMLGISDESGGTAAGSGVGGGNGNSNGIEPGQITAAEWKDLDNWVFWIELVNGQDYSKMPVYWGYNLTKRISVKVKHSSGHPAIDVKVELKDETNKLLWLTRTDNFGEAELWPGLSEVQSPLANLRILVDQQDFGPVKFYSEGINEIVLNFEKKQSQKVCQIAFMVDATGSMSDELEYLKVELVDVLNDVRATNPNTTIVTGSVFYRDEGDVYVTKDSPFTSNAEETIQFIKDQYANGGGDFPEAFHTALFESLNTLQWSPEATSRILFILLDAPPHYENQIVGQIHAQIKLAAEKGIKIIPITASGIDKETEFLMRYMSIATNGTYIFITNDSGIGNEHLEASVGDYVVEYLNDLMVRLINKYLE